MAKLEHKKELIKIKEKQKKSTESKKERSWLMRMYYKKESYKIQSICIMITYTDNNKYVQEKIINNF